MSIFIDPNQTFPITIKLKITGKIDDIATSIKILKPDEDGDDVKLLITKEQYFTLLNDWMSEKQDYCDRYGYMCGENGNFIVFGDFDEVTMLGEEMLDG